MNITVNLDHVSDPDVAVNISQAGLAEQKAMDTRIKVLIRQLDALRREDHLADRMEHLLNARRWPS